MDIPILGHLSWYTIPETTIDREALRDALTDALLPASLLPPPIQAADAFHRATHPLERRRVPDAQGRFVNWLIRDLPMKVGGTRRHLVREVVDADNVRLDYREVAAFWLDRDGLTPRLRIERLQPLTAEEQAALDETRTRFADALTSHPSRALRDIIGRTLRAMDRLSMRPSGGVYFVPLSRDLPIERLTQFVRGIPGGDMWAIPMLDDGENRTAIAHHLDLEVQNTAAQVVDDLKGLLRRRGHLTPGDHERAVNELRELHALAGRYKGLLADRLETIEAALAVAQDQVAHLLQLA